MPIGPEARLKAKVAGKKHAKNSRAATRRPKPKARAKKTARAVKPKLRAIAGGRASHVDELALRLELNSFADELLEECAQGRMSLEATLKRFLPAVSQRLGADGGFVRTIDENMTVESFETGRWHDDDRAHLAREAVRPVTVSADRKRTVIAQPLDVAGRKVGVGAFSFAGDRSADAATLGARIDIVLEQFDDVLAAIQLAAFKQDLIIKLQQALKNVVFDRGVDDAVAILNGSVPLRDVVLLYQDDATGSEGAVRYRIYRDGVCTHDAESRPHTRLRELVRTEGSKVLDHSRAKVQPALGIEGALESVLISGLTSNRTLGKIMATADKGLSIFGRDLLRVFAECVSQRLVDYNRERRHLAQFFDSDTITELLRDPGYEKKFLSPRTDDVALLYADINSFTKISEQVLHDPGKIGRFVDKWSQGAVEIIWKHGGVFDKMVGDCVIGIFGPPFFRASKEERIASCVKAAREILAFTVALEADPDLAEIPKSGVVPGLGVAVGLNLCPASVGLFGPNQDFTAFSSGMNSTARLQSLAGFREILLMESGKDALDPKAIGDAQLEGPIESPVKNVAKPLRYYRLKFPEMTKK